MAVALLQSIRGIDALNDTSINEGVVLPTLDNLRNFLLTPTTEVLKFLPNFAGAVVWHTKQRASKEF
jgi:hypothetical protein